MDFSSTIIPDQKKKQHKFSDNLSDTVNDEFVDEMKRVALEEHKKHHQDEHIDTEARIEVVQDSFSQIEEGEISALLQEEQRKIEESGEYKRITEQSISGSYGGVGVSGGGEYGIASHPHGASATFEATCCGERIVVQSTPSGKIKATNLSEQVKQYQEQQAGGGGGYGKSEGGNGYERGGDQSGFRGYQ